MKLRAASPLLASAAVLLGAVAATPTRAQETPTVVVEPAVASPDEENADEEAATQAAEDAAAAAAEESRRIAEAEGPAPWDAEGRSVYGLYLAGRNALSLGRPEIGAELLIDAQTLSPDQTALQTQAFTAALLAGDLDVAARLTPQDASATIIQAGRLVGVVRQFGRGDARGANETLKAQPIAFPHGRAALFLTPFVAAADRDWERALAPPPPGADPASQIFARYNIALVNELRGRDGEAEAILKPLAETEGTRGVFTLPYARFLDRQRRSRDAVELLQTAVAEGRADVGILAYLSRLEARRRPDRLTPQSAAAEGLAVAAGAAANERAHELSVIYLRLALSLDPSDRYRIQLGQALQEAGLEEASRAAYAQVSDQDVAFYSAAQVQLGFSLQEEELSAEALTAFRRAVDASPSNVGAALALAGALLGDKSYDEALSILNGAVLNTASQPWNVRYLRGAALESLGRHEEAERELWTALEAQPQNAEILNYLGYMWVDNGSRVEQGAEMIGRALAAEPDNGHYQDSLGWAQYRQGDFVQAVETLESATDKEPSSAEINDHLGDAYWRVGRRREAVFQWNRVLTLDPDSDRRASVEAKLERGLIDEAAPVVVAQD